jgi:hypothetical protein
MPRPKNEYLYEQVKKRIMKSYKKPSAFASGAIVKEYKRLGGKYEKDEKEPKLKRWFEEKWVNVNPLINKNKPDAYPLFRPTKRVSKNTPTLLQEVPKKRLEELYKMKQKIKGDSNLPDFVVHHEDEKKGGAIDTSVFKELLNESYAKKPKENVNGYVLDKELSKGASKVYYNPETKHSVVAHKGTSGYKDWLNNLAYAVGGKKGYKMTKRYKNAEEQQRKAEEKYGSKNISTIGHSQGGLQAELLGKRTGEIITLNKATRPFTERKQENQTDIRTKGDVVSKMNKNKYDISIDNPTINPLASHKVDTLDNLKIKSVGNVMDKEGQGIMKKLFGSRVVDKKKQKQRVAKREQNRKFVDNGEDERLPPEVDEARAKYYRDLMANRKKDEINQHFKDTMPNDKLGGMIKIMFAH